MSRFFSSHGRDRTAKPRGVYVVSSDWRRSHIASTHPTALPGRVATVAVTSAIDFHLSLLREMRNDSACPHAIALRFSLFSSAVRTSAGLNSVLRPSLR
jgi:hypothetical protein